VAFHKEGCQKIKNLRRVRKRRGFLQKADERSLIVAYSNELRLASWGGWLLAHLVELVLVTTVTEYLGLDDAIGFRRVLLLMLGRASL